MNLKCFSSVCLCELLSNEVIAVFPDTVVFPPLALIFYAAFYIMP